jgi:hypothetical protein
MRLITQIMVLTFDLPYLEEGNRFPDGGRGSLKEM